MALPDWYTRPTQSSKHNCQQSPTYTARLSKTFEHIVVCESQLAVTCNAECEIVAQPTSDIDEV